MYRVGKPDIMHWLTIHVYNRVQYSDTIVLKLNSDLITTEKHAHQRLQQFDHTDLSF